MHKISHLAENTCRHFSLAGSRRCRRRRRLVSALCGSPVPTYRLLYAAKWCTLFFLHRFYPPSSYQTSRAHLLIHTYMSPRASDSAPSDGWWEIAMENFPILWAGRRLSVGTRRDSIPPMDAKVVAEAVSDVCIPVLKGTGMKKNPAGKRIEIGKYN